MSKKYELTKKELQEIVDGGEAIHIGCQFCDADYVFTPEEIQKILMDL